MSKEVNCTCQQGEAAKDKAEDKEVGRVAGAAVRVRAAGWRDQESGKPQGPRIDAVARLAGPAPPMNAGFHAFR
ncbi:MAG: hypothetical protein WC600_05525 [Desulfobaccales bacterium]